jgi:acetyl esterase
MSGAGPAPIPDDLAPESRAIFAAMDELGLLGEEPESAAEMRELSLRERPLMGPKPEVGRVEERAIEGPAGTIELRIYHPEGGSPERTILWMHGGGWVVGDLEHTDVDARGLCRDTGSLVVSVGYRLAPEHPFPAGLEDSYGALAWARDEIDAGRAPVPLIAAGDSAGGNLAAALCLLTRERSGPVVDGQLLIYPVTDAARDTESYRRFADGYLLTAETMAWFWDRYAGDGESAADPLASVLRAEDLAGLPPAVFVVAGCDVLRDEAEAYAARLAEAGVEVTVLRYPGQLHSFWTYAGVSDIARRVNAEIRAAL